MKILSIQVKNIKGISQRLFQFEELIPNKPNLLVAPNGFGKSSFATAFNSLNSKRLNLDEKDYYRGDQDNEPELTISFKDESNEIVNLKANTNLNQINDEFDIFVINSQLIAKATKMKIGSNTIAQPSMEVQPVVLIESIPQKANFEYKKQNIKLKFGSNSKILPDISSIFCSSKLLGEMNNNIDLLEKLNGKRITNKIENFIETFKEQSVKTQMLKELKKWILLKYLKILEDIQHLNTLYQIISSINIECLNDEIDRFLAAIQIIFIYKENPDQFKKTCRYKLYQVEKKYYQELFESFNSSWIKITLKEEKNKLVIKFPKADQISNGQRDILSFIALLQKAQIKLKKKKCILIIDEVFDYLDDANLISVQYYITQMIEKFKLEQRHLFPLIMTHLNPLYFNHFCFNRHKIRVHFLDKRSSKPNNHIKELIKNRENEKIKDKVNKHYFHYHPDPIDLRQEFNELNLKETWGESQKILRFIQDEINKYLNDNDDFDPFSICFAVRNKIEELLYQKISCSSQKDEFIEKHGTPKKLDYVESLGIDVPETFYLLGLIYNDGLHWHNQRDNITPIAIKLENLTIRKMIKEIFSSTTSSI
jgi:hypothetical protein